MRALFPMCLLLVVVLSGCLGGDDPDAGDGKDGNGGEIIEDAAHVSGEIRNQNLEPVNDARIRLIVDSDVAYEKFTNSTGVFNITIVAPNTYKLQVFAPHCCETRVVQISVGPNEHVERSLLLDLKIPDAGDPYVSDLFESKGFLSCAMYTPTQNLYPCQPYDDQHTREAADTVPETSPGLKTLTAALRWGGNFNLRFNVYNNVGGSNLLASAEGESPLRVQIHNSEIEDEDLKFETYYGENMPLRFEVEPYEPSVIYQEEFMVYWTYHFWEEAPSGFDTLPDN